MDNNPHNTRLAERVAVLESEWQASKEDLKEIKEKLDELLHLKSKGAGALWLIGIIIGSSILGLITLVTTIFQSKPHL